MNARVASAVIVLAVAIVVGGCADQKAKPAAASSSSSTSIDDRPEYETATELGNHLIALGVDCAVSITQTTPSSAGNCVIPASSGGSGIEVNMTVWPTREAGSKGVATMIDYFKTTNRISGKKTYIIAGENWYMDFGIQGVAAGQVKNILNSGTVIPIDGGAG